MSKSHLLDLLFVLFFVSISAIVYTSLNERRVVIEFDIESTRYTRAKLFWNHKSATNFDESRAQSSSLKPGNNRVVISSAKEISTLYKKNNKIMVHPIINPTIIRIDPIEYTGTFSLLSASVRYMDCLLPIISICNYDLFQQKPIKYQQIKFNADSSHDNLSLGDDPYIVWEMPNSHISVGVVYLLNIAILVLFSGSIWVLFTLFSKQKVRTRLDEHILPALLLLLYPTFSLVQYLSINYYYSPSLNRYFLIVAVAIYLGAILWNNLRGLTFNGVIRIGLFVTVTGLILPDFIFHLGLVDRWPFGTEPKEYHWTLGRSFDDNYSQSSLKYHSDLTSIGSLAKRDGIFYSDVATSYYVTSTLPLYSRNPLYHHRLPGVYIKDDEVEALCTGDTEIQKSIVDRLDLDYIIINSDRNNRNVRRNCLSIDDSIIDDIAHRLYEGEFLSLYRVK